MNSDATVLPAIIPAAGLSRRMGTPKQLLELGQGTLLSHVLDALLGANCAPVVCVLGHEATRIAASLGPRAVQMLFNPGYQQGEMLSSIQCALRWLQTQDPGPGSWQGCIMALGDQPLVSSSLVRRLVAVAREQPDSVVYPSHNRRRGHPFVIPACLWSRILALSPAESLRSVMRRPDLPVRYVEAASSDVLQDVDTPEQYRRILNEFDQGQV